MIGPAGNSSNKFNSPNPIGRLLMNNFIQTFGTLFSQVEANSVLEVGCGEGKMLEIMRQLTAVPISGLDMDIPILQEAQDLCPDARLILADGQHLPYPDDSFDLVVACEVLEHVPSPEQMMRELKRVGQRYCLVSVPREPIFRTMNFVRGAYVKDFGNSPGHIQHWSARAFVRLLREHFEVVTVKRPLPWTMVLCKIPQ